MHRRVCLFLVGLFLVASAWSAVADRADAQQLQAPWPYQLNRLYYYPYYFFKHNYWPQMQPQWPEGPGQPYQPPPAYQAYPPFREPNWRYNLWQPRRYHSGSHFWLDQF